MNTVRVGVGVLIFNTKNQILLGKRKNAHGEGHWAPPGGHLEVGESFAACAQREALEEANITLTNTTFLICTNDIFSPEKHYITVFMTSLTHDTPQNMEPHKCEGWQWFYIDALPDALFLSLSNLLKSHGVSILQPPKNDVFYEQSYSQE